MRETYSVPGVIARLRGMKNRSKGDDRAVLTDAIKYLTNYNFAVDTNINMIYNVGNIYKFHADEPLSDFDTGYNAAIRDVLSILRGEKE